MAKTVNGRERSWQIGKPLGSGDAGEVLQAVSLPGNLQGVMKRPLQNVSGGTIVRQAGQIETEGKILKALDGVNYTKSGLTIHTPILLDQSPEGTSQTVNLFMISEEVCGKSISNMLAERLSNGTPIPQNILLKVLSGMLLLLDRVHSKGVSWNDVKMDHIFWDAENKTMSFIDWGNGQFFLPQETGENSPFWTDYVQMLEEGLNLLNQTSPQLIQDLGWPLHSSEITIDDIPQLRMRVEYLETYLSMRAMEYELLFERFTKDLPNLEALAQTLELNNDLRQFGIHTDTERLLSASKTLLFKFLGNNDNDKVSLLINSLENSLKEDLPQEWQLATYLLKQKTTLSNDELLELLDAMLSKNWSDAVWQTRSLLNRELANKELASLIFAMRKIALEKDANSTIYADIRSLINSLEEQLNILNSNPQNSQELAKLLSNLKDQLQAISSSWSILAPKEVLGNQLFNLRQLINEANQIRLKLPQGMQERLQKALNICRDIYQNWNAADFDSALKSIKNLFLNEPTLDYLLPLASELEKAQEDLKHFENGPEAEQSINGFAQNLFSDSDELAFHLGRPDWYLAIKNALRSMAEALNLENLQEQAQQLGWPTPWLFMTGLKLDLPLEHLAQSQLNQEQKDLLQRFHAQIRQQIPNAETLIHLRRLLPVSYSAYKQLDEEFQFILSNLPREALEVNLEVFPAQDRSMVEEAFEALEKVRTWKNAANNGDWFLLKTMAEKFDSHWAILNDLKKATALWSKEILPTINDIKNRNWKSTNFTQFEDPAIKELGETQAHLYTFICEWQKINVSGIYRELLNELVYQADAAQAAFFKAWQALLRTNSKAQFWLIQNQESFFSEINQNLLSIYRSMREVQRNFDFLNQPEMARTRLAQNAAGNLMFLLIRVDETVNPKEKLSPVFKRWQHQYLDLLSTIDTQKIRQGIQEVESIHPLLPWFDELVRRDSGYFEPSQPHQW